MSAMLEAFDTQMVDYQTDPDYIMQLSSSDPWSHEEATMEADGHTPLQTTIEVDMEPYDEEHHQPEYEMEDDLGTSGEALNDVHDVEVYDASRFQSPDIPHDEYPIVNSTQSPDIPHDESPIVKPTQSPDIPHDESPIVKPTQSPDIPHDESSTVDPPQSLTTSAEDIESSTYIISMPKIQNSDDPTFPDAGLPAPHEPESSISLTIEETRTVTILETESNLGDSNLTLTNNVYDSANVAAGELLTEPESEVENLGESPLEEESSEKAPVHADSEFNGDEVNEHAEGTASPEFEDSTSDPHEISEGVYIDPPPPVLISLYAEEPTISLFNIPSKSGLDSRMQQNSHDDLVLLLGQLPTLYYEPLSSVFEALRQEEFLSSIPDLLTGELLLDAYDLELTMSEDYTYAHEFSLHDLNVLHDGLNKRGPLRLRLKSVATRFIDRYHLLQSQITEVQGTETLAEREISKINPSPEELSDASQAARVETLGKIFSSDAAVFGTNPSNQNQAEVSGVDHVTKEDATDTESYHQEVDNGPVVPENSQNQHEDNESEEETEPSATEERYDPEEEFASVESTTLLVETTSVEAISNRDIPECESEPNKNAGSQYIELENLDNSHTHADDKNQPNEPEQASAAVASHELTEMQHPDHGVDSQIPENSIVLTHIQEKDIAHVDEYHPDKNETQGDDEGSVSGSDLVNPVHSAVEFNLTNEANEEQDYASFEAIDDLVEHDDTWDDSLDGEGDWEAEDDEKGYEYGDEQSFRHGHEHEHEHDTVSNSSSVTLSSKASFKRSLSEAELEDYREDEFSTGSKKPRVEYETF
ncbi:hypothetical protein C0993_008087 [Termitomyces sp. T159_Od127]|nr:hypothetical protein C0993_008087 [Termitomyces sp. T159_Od127]